MDKPKGQAARRARSGTPAAAVWSQAKDDPDRERNSKRLYPVRHFMDAWERYLPGPSPARSATGETSATSSGNQALIVAEDVSDVADAVADKHEEKSSKFNLVAAVADVADFPGGGEIKCAQCGEAGDLKEVWYGELNAQVHAYCQDAWVAAQDDGLTIPSYLDRRGELSS